MIKNLVQFIILTFNMMLLGQGIDKNPISITPEFLLGITGEANSNFPNRKAQKQVFINLGWHNENKNQEWVSILKNPKTGLSLGYADLGNKNELGSIFTFEPFIELDLIKSKKLKLHIGKGISYATRKYNPITNQNNKAVSTDFTWSFRMFIYYKLLSLKNSNYRLGIGYNHNSNGHLKLPNQGFNSLLVSLGTELICTENLDKYSKPKNIINKSKYKYSSFRFGFGQHVLSESFNTTKDVITISGEYGKVYNNTFKFGIGSFIRFYESYYDYISNNESLVQDGREFAELKKNAFTNALNIGITFKSEVILNHIGIDVQFGINIYKPAYKIDWRINQGWGHVPQEIPENGGHFRLGDINETYYRIKHIISARLGLKYYIKATSKKPKHNFYIGTFINSNLGQADFSEIAIGYTRKLKHK